MKLAFFNDFTLGVVTGDRIVDVSAAVSDIPHVSPQDLINGVIERFAQYREPIQRAAEQGTGIELDSVRLRSPIPKPHNVVAMAVIASHLYHGVWSLFQTLGLDNPDRNRGLRRFAAVTAIVLFAGFCAIPVAFYLGFMPEPPQGAPVGQLIEGGN